MGAILTKPPTRVILPDDEGAEPELMGSDFVDTEKQEGEDALGVTAVEDSYPEPEPINDVTPSMTHGGGSVSRMSKKSQETKAHMSYISEEPTDDIENGVTGSIVAKTPPRSFTTPRVQINDVRPGTPSEMSHRKIRQGYPLSAWPTANMITKGGMPTLSVIHGVENGRVAKSLYSGANSTFNQTTVSFDATTAKTLKQRELMLRKRELFESRTMMSTRAEQRTFRGQLSARSEFKPPEAIDDITPLKDIDYSAADKNAEQCKSHRAESYSALVRDLTSGLESDALKVWAILSWISKQRIGKLGFGTKIPKPDTPNGYMKLIQEGQGTYPAFFALICREAGIKCAIINGVSKSAGYEVGETNMDELRNTWNAVHLDGGWRLVHPLWVFRYLSGHQHGGWMTIEKSGIAMMQANRAANGQDVATYNKYYIFTDPKEFVYRNLPDEENWQLLKEPWSQQKFVTMPFLRPEFFKGGFKILSEEKCVLVSEDGGEQTIVIGVESQTCGDLVFSYEFSYRVEEEEMEANLVSEIPQNAERYIVVLKADDRVSLDVRFPMKGNYRLRLFGGLFSKYGDDPPWISDVRLECLADPPVPNPLPFNPGVVGWGPGPIAESYGLHVPSHERGLIDLSEDEPTIIQFMLLRRIEIKIELLHVRMKADYLAQFIEPEIIAYNESIELRVVVRCPGANIKKEELALKMDVWNKESHALENACNYIIHTRKERPKEAYYVRKARKMLNDAMLTNDVTALEAAMAACKKQDFHEDDPEVRGGRNRLEYLQCKEALRYSLHVNRIDVSTNAIQRSRSARFEVLLARDIRRAEAHLEEIRDLNSGGWSKRIPDIDRSALMEMSHLRKPKESIKHILVAMFLLLGVEEEHLKKWNKIQQLLRSEEDTLVEMARLERDLNIDSLQIVSPDGNAVARVQAILDTYSEEEIRRIDNTAAAFYQWISSVTRLLREKTQKRTPKHHVSKVPRLKHIFEDNDYLKYSRDGKPLVQPSMRF